MRSLRYVAVTMAFLALGLASGVQAKDSRADLSRLVVVGDSLSAGFQNGSLLAGQQVHGYASLVAQQAGVELPLPEIAYPGIPNVLILVDPGPPPLIVEATGASTGRVNPFVQPFDLAVPGARVADALDTRPDVLFQDLTDLVLGLPGLLGGISRSQVEWAEALQPTTMLVWIGNVDALGAAIGGDASLLTPLADFEASYAELMQRLSATDATIVVGNIPDVTAIAFLTSAEDLAALVGAPLALIGPVLGIAAGDYVLPEAVATIAAQGITGPLPADQVLDAGEVALIRSAVDGFNKVIERQAKANHAAVVDVHGLLEVARKRGLEVGRQRLTTDFLGGLFSLDGIHPTNTGYAILANEFIETLNDGFDARIPRVDEREVLATDPLVFETAGDASSASGHVHPDKARELRGLYNR
jgi:GDSL-like lipase/acylhydrolase family protein